MTRRLACLAALLLTPGLPAVAEEVGAEAAVPAEYDAERWAVRLARMEGASVNIEEAAAQLVQTAEQVSRAGRLTHLAELSSDARLLNLRIVSAGLAAEVLDE